MDLPLLRLPITSYSITEAPNYIDMVHLPLDVTVGHETRCKRFGNPLNSLGYVEHGWSIQFKGGIRLSVLASGSLDAGDS